MFYVSQKYFDNGRTEMVTLSEKELRADKRLVKILENGGKFEGKNFDEYIDDFGTEEEAIEFVEQEV